MTRQQKARQALTSRGYAHAKQMLFDLLDDQSKRNQQITQRVIFDGAPLGLVGLEFGLSRERVRQIGLVATRNTIGRYSDD